MYPISYYILSRNVSELLRIGKLFAFDEVNLSLTRSFGVNSLTLAAVKLGVEKVWNYRNLALLYGVVRDMGNIA